MRISINWLRELVKIAQSPQELAELLTIAGIEVEEIEDRREWAKGVVIGKIIDRQPHPNADKLSVCQVDIGQENLSTIVCGAPNARADILVPVATLGTHLPKINLTIKPAKLRGVKSEGMICSLAELGLTKDSEGIHIFSQENLPLGTDVRPLLGLDEVILDISPTANRADALSMIGVAREVAALTGGELSLPKVKLQEFSPKKDLTLEISENKACPAYIGTVIEGVKIAHLRYGCNSVYRQPDCDRSIMWSILLIMYFWSGDNPYTLSIAIVYKVLPEVNPLLLGSVLPRKGKKSLPLMVRKEA